MKPQSWIPSNRYVLVKAFQEVTPEEEVTHMREQLGVLSPLDIMYRIGEHFNVQSRAGMMISLIRLLVPGGSVA